MRRLLAGVALLAGCAAYTPAPVSTVAQLETYDARALDDPALRAWFDSLGVAAPSAAWNPRQLAIAALWLRADRGVREARIREADAALVTAGAQPQPGVSTDVEYAFTDPQADSRWGLALAGLFTVELGGKRGARLGWARAEALAERARVREEEWHQAGEVYRAALDFEEARRNMARATGERRLLDSLVELAQARFDAGALTRLDLARLQGEQRAALVEEQRAAESARVARRTLAGVVGLPAGRDSSLEVAPTQWPPCGGDSTDRAALQRSALESRWNVRRAAAEYQVAEGDLRLQVANASPDLTLGPGLFFDQGTGKFTLGLGLPSLQLTRNRGPIAEAEARRRLAGARLLQEQETVLTEVDSALTRCAAVTDEATSVAALVREAEQRRDLVRAAWARGETGRLELLTADLELRRAQREALDAGRRQREAGLGLDLALGAWGLRQDGDWPRRKER